MIKVNQAENFLENRIGGNTNDLARVWDVFKSFGKEQVAGEEETALLFQCGVYDFTGEELFHFDFVRQFAIEEEGQRRPNMPGPSIRVKKIWEDVDFFEINLEFNGLSCIATIDIYTSNDELEDLRQGMKSFSNFQQDEFTWISGMDNENTTHFLSIRFFAHNKTGIVGIEVVADNKEEKPYWMRSNFFILTELNQIDDFERKLENLINEDIDKFESLIPVIKDIFLVTLKIHEMDSI